MTKRLRSEAIWLIILMVGLIAALTYRQAFSDELVAHPGNRRALLAEFLVERGNIYDADHGLLAASKLENGEYRRFYPQGAPFAPVTGYYDQVRGRFGLESEWTGWLSAQTHFRSVNDWLTSLANKPRRGFDLTLTIKPEWQLAAWRLLGERRGAILVLEPKSGAVRALVSKPTYDPNEIKSKWNEISASPDALLVNKAVQGLYPPGSTFKIITTATGLEDRTTKPTKVYDGPASLPVYGSKVTNFADQDAGRMPLETAFAKSTNTIFAQVGLELGAKRLVGGAERFGFNARPPFDIKPAVSSTPEPGEMDKVLVAWTAVGQGRTLATPLQMALSAAAIAADGQVYSPYMVETVRDYRGAAHYRRRAKVWRRPISRSVAGEVKAMMVRTVESGTGRSAALPGIKVAGKTGTAEVGGGEKAPHAWFVGFAPAEDPRAVIVVLVENGGLGGQTAAPIARELLKEIIE